MHHFADLNLDYKTAFDMAARLLANRHAELYHAICIVDEIHACGGEIVRSKSGDTFDILMGPHGDVDKITSLAERADRCRYAIHVYGLMIPKPPIPESFAEEFARLCRGELQPAEVFAQSVISPHDAACAIRDASKRPDLFCLAALSDDLLTHEHMWANERIIMDGLTHDQVRAELRARRAAERANSLSLFREPPSSSVCSVAEGLRELESAKDSGQSFH
jgi:hypothetical protein